MNVFLRTHGNFLLALPVLVPPLMAMRIDWTIAAEMVLIALAIALIVQVQRRAERRRLQRDRRSDPALRAAAFLDDFEKDGRGWFWETDRQGIMRYITPQVAMRSGIPVEDIIGKPFIDLISQVGKHHDEREERTLGFHLSSRTPFSDLSIKVASDEERWWSVSGNPVLDDLGNFHGFRGSGTDLTDMRETQNAFQQLARYDTLTGLANRLEINRLLEQSLKGHLGRTEPCTLFLLDLDRFKQVNDTLGHPAGDSLLVQVADRLQRVVGDRGTVGRIGGDEFQVVLPKLIQTAELERLAAHIIEALSIPYIVEGSQVRIGASIGIAIHELGEVQASSLVRNADLSLYCAKDAGRGTYRFYEAAMHEEASERRTLEEDLRDALNRGELSLVYQPVVDVSTEKITGFEVLCRWDHPVKGPISPAVFIPIAEEANLISRIGEWTIRSACEQIAQWPGDLRIAVNVSPLQFARGDIAMIVTSAVAQSGIHPSQLELEVTESVFLDGGDENIAIFNAIKATGVRLALDDFGTGYSALGYLKKAPFDKIKIDQSFVRGAAQKGSMNGAIIASIVSLADALGMDTTAEGAETHDELLLVRELGCSHVQGYIYGKPMKAEAAAELLTLDDGYARADGFQSNRLPRKRLLRKIGVLSEGFCYEGLVRNISVGGAMIDGLWAVPPGTRFELELDNDLVVSATARWSEENRMGVEFDRPISLTDLGMRGRMKVQPGWRDGRDAPDEVPPVLGQQEDDDTERKRDAA